MPASASVSPAAGSAARCRRLRARRARVGVPSAPVELPRANGSGSSGPARAPAVCARRSMSEARRVGGGAAPRIDLGLHEDEPRVLLLSLLLLRFCAFLLVAACAPRRIFDERQPRTEQKARQTRRGARPTAAHFARRHAAAPRRVSGRWSSKSKYIRDLRDYNSCEGCAGAATSLIGSSADPSPNSAASRASKT